MEPQKDENLNFPIAPVVPLLSVNGEFVQACKCLHGIDRLAYIESKRIGNFFRAKHQEALVREDNLKNELNEAKGEIRLLKQKLFGKKSEIKNKSEKQNSNKSAPSSRGQQKNSKGHGRRENKELPVVDEFISLPDDDLKCHQCGLLYSELSGTEDSEILEIEVKAHKRRIKRKKYKRHSECECAETPIIITAPRTPRLLNKMTLGISIWVDVLIRKYDEQCPLNRILMSLDKHGISIPTGTVIGGLKRLQPLFLPIAKRFEERCQQDIHWHADETRWKVFEKTEGKNSYNWYLWVFRGTDSVTYRIEPTRGYIVPASFFENVKGGILSCDRYVVYKKIADNFAIILALCWAHVRRDFLDAAKSSPALDMWSMAWVENIRECYHLNKERLAFQKTTKAYQVKHVDLKNKLNAMEAQFTSEIADPTLDSAAKKILISLKNHWKGLTVFLDHPEIPMDNNKGEQSIRPSTLGRKNYYGSGSTWSAELTAILFSLFATLALWKLNARTWLYEYLRACEDNGGEIPNDLTPFIPWEMSNEQINKLSKPPDG